jgi:hypothetical protein
VYFDRLRGYDDEISMEFSLNFQNIRGKEYIIIVRGLEIHVDEATINRVSCLPMDFPWDKDERQEASDDKNLFFLSYEEPIEDKNGVKRERLPEPWPEVAYHLLKYITCEGRLSVVYSYHFIFLHQLRHLFHQNPKENLIIPYFILQLLER